MMPISTRHGRGRPMTRKDAGWLLALVGTFVAVWASLQPDPADFARWTTAPGEVVSLRMGYGGGGRHAGHYPVIEYTYDVGDYRYTGRRIMLGGYEPGPRADAYAFLEAYPSGTSVEVWHDPEDPGRSYLFRPRPRLDPNLWISLGTLVALGGIAFGFWKEEGPAAGRLRRHSKDAGSPRPTVRVLDRPLRGLRLRELRGDVSRANADPLRLELVPESPETAAAKRRGMGELEVGDAAFDDAFFVSTNLPARALEVLTPAVRERCLALAELLDGSYTSIQLDRLFLTVGKVLPDDREVPPAAQERLLVLYQELRALVVAALTGRTVPGEAASPDELTITGADEEGEAWVCLVCGEGAARDVRACPVCETRHHEECWRYAGGCALFACPGGAGGPT